MEAAHRYKVRLSIGHVSLGITSELKETDPLSLEDVSVPSESLRSKAKVGMHVRVLLRWAFIEAFCRSLCSFPDITMCSRIFASKRLGSIRSASKCWTSRELCYLEISLSRSVFAFRYIDNLSSNSSV